MANNFKHSHTFAKHCLLNKEKYSTLLFQEFEKRFQDFRQNQQSFLISATPFFVDINILHLDFQIECIEVQSDVELKEKFDHFSLLDFYELYLPKEKYPKLNDDALFMSSLFGSTYICEQLLFSRMKHTKNKTRTKIFHQHRENSLRIANNLHQTKY